MGHHTPHPTLALPSCLPCLWGQFFSGGTTQAVTGLSGSLQNIFTWCGGKSNILERNKARDLALAIRDSERQGKAQVEIITDGEEPAEMIQVGDTGGGGRELLFG